MKILSQLLIRFKETSTKPSLVILMTKNQQGYAQRPYHHAPRLKEHWPWQHGPMSVCEWSPLRCPPTRWGTSADWKEHTNWHGSNRSRELSCSSLALERKQLLMFCSWWWTPSKQPPLDGIGSPPTMPLIVILVLINSSSVPPSFL